MSSRVGQTWTVVAIFGISVVGYVALVVAGRATAEYLALVGPILATLFLVPRLGQIEHNTNGALTKRIEEAVGNALDERLGPRA